MNADSDEPLKMYEEEFEAPYIEATKTYYLKESTTALQTLTIKEFMTQALNRLAEEAKRNEKYCHKHSLSKIQDACEAQYVAHHKNTLENEFQTMINEENTECFKN